MVLGCELDSFGSKQRPAADPCEHCNEASSSVIGEKIPVLTQQLLLSQEIFLLALLVQVFHHVAVPVALLLTADRALQ